MPDSVPGSTEPAQRREVYFSGRVQGVGFRYTTRQIAVRFPVAGFVQNLSDGRVFVVVEGEPADLERFLGAVESEMQRYVEAKQVLKRPATGEFSRFEIRH